MPSPTGRNTTRHREAGAASRAETRRRLLDAAGHEFAERGYSGATVTRIAGRAGVTVQTLYLAWGSKRELLRAYMESVLAGRSDIPYAQELPHLIADALDGVGDDARSVVAQISHLFRKSAERAALGWQLYRDAAATDTAVATDWQTLQRLRRHTFTEIVGRIPADALRAGLTHDAAADTAWTIVSPETYDLLVRIAGYTLDDYEQWATITLTAALLDS